MPSKHQLRVAEFMDKAGQRVPQEVEMRLPREVRELRANLILEEAFETISALGFDMGFVENPEHEGEGQPETLIYLQHNPDKFNFADIVDGCADLMVVTTGTLCALGVDDEVVLEEVDSANLRKFGPGSYRRETDGKWMKPPDFVEPDFMSAVMKGKPITL